MWHFLWLQKVLQTSKQLFGHCVTWSTFEIVLFTRFVRSRPTELNGLYRTVHTFCTVPSNRVERTLPYCSHVLYCSVQQSWTDFTALFTRFVRSRPTELNGLYRTVSTFVDHSQCWFQSEGAVIWREEKESSDQFFYDTSDTNGVNRIKLYAERCAWGGGEDSSYPPR